MIGKGHSGALVTIVERSTLFTLCARVNDKSANTVAAATIKLLTPFQDSVLSITSDNGKEFALHEEVSEALNTDFYFADPYASWQRGLNENTNGLLRQYWPKATDFKAVTHACVDRVTTRLNNRPRKSLNFRSPAEAMQLHLRKMAV